MSVFNVCDSLSEPSLIVSHISSWLSSSWTLTHFSSRCWFNQELFFFVSWVFRQVSDQWCSPTEIRWKSHLLFMLGWRLDTMFHFYPSSNELYCKRCFFVGFASQSSTSSSSLFTVYYPFNFILLLFYNCYPDLIFILAQWRRWLNGQTGIRCQGLCQRGASLFLLQTLLHSVYILCYSRLQIRPQVIWGGCSHRQLFKLNRFPGTPPAVYWALLLFQVYSLLCLMMLSVFTESSFPLLPNEKDGDKTPKPSAVVVVMKSLWTC